MSTMMGRVPKKARSAVVGGMPGMPGMPGMFQHPQMMFQHPQMLAGLTPQQMMAAAAMQADDDDEDDGRASMQAEQQAPAPATVSSVVQAPPSSVSSSSSVPPSSVPPSSVPVQSSVAVASFLPGMEDAHTRLPDAQISRSITYVKNVPRNRISEVLEEVDPQLDPAFTSELTPEGMLTTMWLYCRVKPTVKISDLRVLANFIFKSCNYIMFSKFSQLYIVYL